MVEMTFDDSIVDPILKRSGKLLICSRNNLSNLGLSLQLCSDLIDQNKFSFLDSFQITRYNCPKNILFVSANISKYDLEKKLKKIMYDYKNSDYQYLTSFISFMDKSVI